MSVWVHAVQKGVRSLNVQAHGGHDAWAKKKQGDAQNTTPRTSWRGCAGGWLCGPGELRPSFPLLHNLFQQWKKECVGDQGTPGVYIAHFQILARGDGEDDVIVQPCLTIDA